MLHNIFQKVATATPKQGKVLYVPRGDHFDDLVYELPYQFFVLSDLQNLKIRYGRADNTYVIGSKDIPVQGYDLIINNGLATTKWCYGISRERHIPLLNLVHEAGHYLDKQGRQEIRTIFARTNSVAMTKTVGEAFGVKWANIYPGAAWSQNTERVGSVALTGDFKGSGALVGLLPEIDVKYRPFRDLVLELEQYAACFVTQLHEEVPFLAAVARTAGCRIVGWASLSMGEYRNENDYLSFSIEDMKQVVKDIKDRKETRTLTPCQDPAWAIHQIVREANKEFYLER